MDSDIGDINDIITEMDCEVKEKTSSRFRGAVHNEDLISLIEVQQNQMYLKNGASREMEKLSNFTYMNHWFERFIVEARKKDGSEYPQNHFTLFYVNF
jgi:hypothetical protein